MKRGLMLLADGFEDTEGLTTRDVLVRAGIEMTTASIRPTNQVTSSFGINLMADTTIGDINSSYYDFLVLPGGGKGTANLKASNEVSDLIDEFVNDKKLVCAICAAPSILGRKGLLNGKRYTCFAGCQEGKGIYTGKEVVVSGNYITARSMMYSVPFALAIVQKLLGKEAKEKVLVGLKGQANK